MVNFVMYFYHNFKKENLHFTLCRIPAKNTPRKHQTNQTVTDSLQKDWAVLFKGVKTVDNAETLSNDHRSARTVTQ